jgi:hypothetical protein
MRRGLVASVICLLLKGDTGYAKIAALRDLKQSSNTGVIMEVFNRIERVLIRKVYPRAPLLSLHLLKGMRELTEGRKPPLPNGSNLVPKNLGFELFAPGDFPQVMDVVSACKDIYAGVEQQIATTFRKSGKSYFFNVMDANAFRAHPVIADFALSEPIASAAVGYLGGSPRLHSIGLYYSPVNDTTEGSQLFHCDGDDLTQLKVFVNIWPVEGGAGEFTFVPKNLMTRWLRSRGLTKALDDDAVRTLAPEDTWIRLTGAAGNGVFVDTSRCLHQGSRSRGSPRLVLMFQYVNRPDALPSTISLKRTNWKFGLYLSVTKELLAGLPISNPRAMDFVD